MAFSACGTDDSSVDIAYVEYGGEPFTMNFPMTVAPSTSFSVEINTYGNGCVTDESTDLATDGDISTITPYNRREIPTGGGCPAILKTIVHTVSFEFSTLGPKLIRVKGRKLRIGDADGPGGIEIQHEVTIDVQ